LSSSASRDPGPTSARDRVVPPGAPSGAQYEISFGDQVATIVEVGGGVREYRVGDRNVLDPYPVEMMCDGAHGAPLVPWPNRLADGRYTWDGVDYQVDISEPPSNTAIHGFLRWRNWVVSERSASAVTVESMLHPLAGYPFSLEVRVTYALSADGLTVTTEARNVGTAAAPWACGQHPYLSAGGAGELLDGCELQFVASERIDTDDRQLPRADVPVAGTEYDFGQPRLIAELAMDFAFKQLERDADGRAWIRLTGADGRRAEMWVDESYPIVELYTGDTLQPPRRRLGLGCEPMSAPPNAFGSGIGVLRLEPGATVTHRWGARLS
jgi:aldose 1-epimerase